jgi:hypothetical protein
LEQIRPSLEARADRTGQCGQPFDGGGELAAGDAGLLVERGQALATGPAVVAGPPVVQQANEADDGTLAIDVIACRLLAMGTGYTGALVAVFF